MTIRIILILLAMSTTAQGAQYSIWNAGSPYYLVDGTTQRQINFDLKYKGEDAAWKLLYKTIGEMQTMNPSVYTRTDPRIIFQVISKVEGIEVQMGWVAHYADKGYMFHSNMAPGSNSRKHHKTETACLPRWVKSGIKNGFYVKKPVNPFQKVIS